MSDLRRRALGGGKTPSKKSTSKATSKQSSTAGSRVNSKVGSRVASAAPSRQVTDDEGWDSEGTVWSMASLDGELSGPEDAPTVETWQEDLADRIARITDKDRKKLAVYGLEEALTAYSRILMCRYVCEEIEGKTTGIIEALMRSIKAGKTDKETILAAQSLIVTVITDPDCLQFPEVVGTLQRTITDHPHLPVKTALIHALAATAFYTDASTYQTESVMDFFHEIIENDGHTIGAGDDSGVVTAAIEEWGFLATVIDDAEEITERSIDAFVDQLDSAEIDVQVAAGEVIALLYEKAYREHTDDDDDDDSDEDAEIKFSSMSGDGPPPVEKYVVFRNTSQLKQTLNELSRSSAKNVSKRNRRTQHTSFANVLHTVEHPLHGPNYSRALDIDGRERGSRLEFKLGKKGTVTINSWWKLVRWNALRRFLAGGVIAHWEFNNVVFTSLPLMVETPKVYKKAKPDREVVR